MHHLSRVQQPVPTVRHPLQGLWKGDYGPNGIQIVEVLYDFTGSAARLVATKVYPVLLTGCPLCYPLGCPLPNVLPVCSVGCPVPARMPVKLPTAPASVCPPVQPSLDPMVYVIRNM